MDGELESIYRKTFSMEISQKALKGDFQFSGSPSFKKKSVKKLFEFSFSRELEKLAAVGYEKDVRQ